MTPLYLGTLIDIARKAEERGDVILLSVTLVDPDRVGETISTEEHARRYLDA